jgi:ATP-dependent helicase YprA (DUF1998 family)
VDVFDLRARIIDDYSSYISSFINIRNEEIRQYVDSSLREGLLWPEPLIQLNPAFEPGGWIDDLVDEGLLHEECRKIFRIGKTEASQGKRMRLHRHQADAIRVARGGHNYVLTTGTGSGKSLAYIIPIVDHVLRNGSGRGVQAIIVYPMNALANSQAGELEKFLKHPYADGHRPVTFRRYTGQEKDEERQQIKAHPPDIILTNYVMLELMLTRPYERELLTAAQGLRFLVLDELHTYRGRQGADVALLVRRVRDRLSAGGMQCIGTSATLASTGPRSEQQAEVAGVAATLFGAPVAPENVVGETLRRLTPDPNLEDPDFIAVLTERVRDPERRPPQEFQAFIEDPLSSWIETIFGLASEPEGGRLIRTQPKSISGPDGAAHLLSEATGLDQERCAEAIREGLLGGYQCEPNPETGFPPFAFRLHQFISRGDTVYASLEAEEERVVTVHGQRYVPGDRTRILLPLAFCRACGQEFYCVELEKTENGPRRVAPRELNEISGVEGTAGYLYVSRANPWPDDPEEVINRLPDDWLEAHTRGFRVKYTRRPNLPTHLRISPSGEEVIEGEGGVDAAFLPAPFRFCPQCGISYNARQRTDFGKLASLASEGRSTATTILSMSAVRNLRKDESLKPEAQKLLSFTDNRQDASLQAGHFNDFVEVGLLRSALYRAALARSPEGMSHDEITQRVFDALDLPKGLYAINPDVRFTAAQQTDHALRDVIGYRIYRDLQRGWRLTSPNLEQCGLLQIQYLSLEDVAAAPDIWENCHEALQTAQPATRERVARALLDYMRRELAIKVNYLEHLFQEQIQQRSSQLLVAPWALDENEQLEHAAILYPRSKRDADYGGNIFLSARGGFAQFISRPGTFEDYHSRLSTSEIERILREILRGMEVAGIVTVVQQPTGENDVPGYQLAASALRWVAGDGTQPFHDPIRVPRASDVPVSANQFFVHYYRTMASEARGLMAREHTAQVPGDRRMEREEQFRTGTLPILYCSPTMELGVDIAELNAVNMRNVPPTPANYAQRSGRAGRSGQPALVFSYCSTGSPHDQYFFRRPDRMVMGSVTPPRLDLANEELVRAHIHAVWLAETGQALGTSLKDILDLAGDQPSLELQPGVRDSLNSPAARAMAERRARAILSTFESDLAASDWYSDHWVEGVLQQVMRSFEEACDRWRALYRSALSQSQTQDRIIRDATRPHGDREQARRLRREAEAQLELLTQAESIAQSDFYSYRYFASEGFLPGYNFPRLPLSAYIPGRRIRNSRDEFLSRPRFLAISEFGPRAIVYHEGSRYVINKAILPVRDNDQDITTYSIKQCPECGYLHPLPADGGPDTCNFCETHLEPAMHQLFRLQNVATKRRDSINSDEEERFRLGYQIRTGIRFAALGGGQASFRTATLMKEGAPLAFITYGHAANIWRINLGWKRRAKDTPPGFVLDLERGYWAKNPHASEEDPEDPMTARTQRVIPFVQDRRNCLLIQMAENIPPESSASIQAALKNAIQVRYQLEDMELAAEPLPDRDHRRRILLFEAAEGGAGVLRRLLDEPRAFAEVAREALSLCHFDPETGDDRRRHPGAREDCEAACYDCLMSYANQLDHELLDRQSIRALLMDMSAATVVASPVGVPRAVHLEALKRLAGSELERRWLDYLEEHNYRLPDRAQFFVEDCNTRPDFYYSEYRVAVYIDGPPHDYPERQQRDQALDVAMEDNGYHVIRFHHTAEWDDIIARNPNIFGRNS